MILFLELGALFSSYIFYILHRFKQIKKNKEIKRRGGLSEYV